MSIDTDECPEQFLTEVEVSVLLNVSARTLQGWRLRGGGPPFIKLSRGMVRYRRSDLDDYLRRRCFASTSEAGETR